MAVRVGLIWLLTAWQVPGLAESGQGARDARDLISARAWLDDPSNSLGPEEVRTMNWTPYAGPLRLGFKQSTTWLLLRIEPPDERGRRSVDRETRLVLRILPGHLDEIALFDPRRPHQPPLFAGDTYDWRHGEYRSFNQNLVTDMPSEPTEMLLRLRTTSNHGIHVQALSRDDAGVVDRQQQLLIGAVIMFLTMILLWAVLAWLDRRDRVIAAFICHQMVSILFTLTLLGFARVYLSEILSPRTISHLTSAGFTLVADAVLWFHWHLLREFRPPPLGMRCLKWLAILTPFSLVFMALGLTSLGLQMTLVIAMLTPLLLLILAVLSAKPVPEESPRLSRRYLVVAYSLMLIILWNATLPAFGWLPSPPWSMYSAIAYGVVSGAILLSVLRARARYFDAAHREAQVQLALTAQAVQQERKIRQEQEQFLTMLTHEMTNALATAHLAIGSLDQSSPMRARGYRAVDSIRDIVRRCALSGEFETTEPLQKIKMVDLKALVQEVCAQSQAPGDIRQEVPIAATRCETDAQLLSIAIGNLLDNALKYRAAESLVDVRLASESRGHRPGLQVSVSNECGEAGHPDPSMVFKKYWRGPSASRFAGSGLGLYLASLIAGRLGGDLQYHYESPHARFVLWLPA